MHHHRIFGVTLASEFPFETRLAAGTPPADLTFSCSADAGFEIAGQEPAFASAGQTPEGESLAALYRLEAADVLRFAGLADFYVSDERIECVMRDRGREVLLEIRLLGDVLSFWLERRGIPTLHASAVEVAGRSVGFLSTNSGGKTALAAALMSRGHRLLTDDVLALEERRGAVFGRSGYPQLRMWPDQAALYLTDWQKLEIVHPEFSKRRVVVGSEGLGSFCGSTLPLACLYLPHRRPPAESRAIEVANVRPRDAVVELLRHSFLPHLVEAAGWQARRLDVFARLLERVPVRRLFYPAGFEHLPSVCDAILRDPALQ